MRKEINPMNQLLNRVSTWCGVRIDEQGGVPCVRIRDHVIARFPSSETLEASLCGTIKRQFGEDPEDLPEGVWPHENNEVLLIDLKSPRGMEEAIRVLLNAYILSQDPMAQDWWLGKHRLEEDPTCEKIAQVISHYRLQPRASDTSG